MQVVNYNQKADSLLLQIDDVPAISVDCGGLFWLRVNPKNKQVIGVEIEGLAKILKEQVKTKVYLSK